MQVRTVEIRTYDVPDIIAEDVRTVVEAFHEGGTDAELNEALADCVDCGGVTITSAEILV